MDSDASGNDYKNKLISDLYKDESTKIIEMKDITEMENSEVEDLIPYSCLEKGFDRLLRDIEDDEFNPNEDTPILPQFEKYANEHHIPLPNGYKVGVAKLAKTKILSLHKEEKKVKCWEKLFKKIK